MAALSSRTTISQLAGAGAHLVEILNSCHLLREGDDPEATLAELCYARGFNTGILLTLLQSALARNELAPTPPPLDLQPFHNMPLQALVDHIEQVHHTYLRAELPRLTALANALAGAASGAEERLLALRDIVQELATELHIHLQHEEEALFAMVRDITTKGAITPTRCGSSVGGPIACMENDHVRAAAALGKISELTDSHSTPAGASEAYRALMDGLARLDKDLREHMYKENDVLFPRALAAQRKSGAFT
jgi:regulator of cell morphogenesis and NO signaling